MTRFVAVGVLLLAIAGGAVYVVRSQPPWYERIRYPLRYQGGCDRTT